MFLQAISIYKAYLKKMATRVNTFTGVAYKDDQTIFAWDLLNEPRYPQTSNPTVRSWNVILPLPPAARSLLLASGNETSMIWNAAAIPDPAATVTAWYNMMAAYMKSVDPNHMVSILRARHRRNGGDLCGRS